MKLMKSLPLILIIMVLFALPAAVYGLETTAETEVADIDDGPARGIDELYAFTFNLEGDAYTLPFPVTDLLDKGWTFASENGDTMLAPYEYSWDEELANGDLRLRVKLKNFSESDLTYEQAEVAGISVYQMWGAEVQTEFELPGGISLGTPIKEVTAYYGQPNQLSEYNVVYGHDGYAGLSVNIETNDRNEPVAGSISYTRLFVPANPEDVDGLDLKDIPDVADYVPPEELGIKLANMVLSLDGKLMRLPVPLSELLTDGWTVAYVYGYTDATVLDPSASVTAYLIKGNSILESTISNHSQTEKVPLESCLVLDMREQNTEPYADQNKIVLAQDIGIGSDRRSVVLLYLDLKPNVSVYGTQETYSIRFREGNTDVTVEDDVVVEIYVSSGW